jgi:hypothetical protein
MSEEKTIECQGEGCGREAYELDENYYACQRCGWAGTENNPVVFLNKEIDNLLSQLRDCHDLLNDCGFFFENGIWIDGDYREGEE